MSCRYRRALRGRRGVTAAGRLAHARLDLVAQEDPAAAELVAGNHAAPRELEDRGERHVEQPSHLAGIEHVVFGEVRVGGLGARVHRYTGILDQISKKRVV
jgi:hypothetical protein